MLSDESSTRITRIPTTTHSYTLKINRMLKKWRPIKKSSVSHKGPFKMVRYFCVRNICFVCSYKHFALFLIILTGSLTNCSEDNAVYINFPKKNDTKLSRRYFYLPPSLDDGVIIDNRIRTGLLDFDRFQFHRVYGNNQELLRNNLRLEGDFNNEFVRINEMGCENSAKNVYFRVLLLSLKSVNDPIIETRNSEFCKIEKLDGNEYRINLNREQFANCGIVDCSDESNTFYCLTLRFPYINGLKLKEDFTITLQCKPRERVASHIKKINVKSLDATARMTPRVAIGGYKNTFETDIALYRRTFASDNTFDAKVEAGGTVVLGEQLLLKVAVKEGDGWRYSKIAEVKVHQFEKNDGQKVKIKSMWLLDSNGCVNARLRDICSGEQFKASPLESYLLFEAFMFDNMKEDDEMVLSVKAIGCVDGVDCTLNCPTSHLRKTRSLDSHNNDENKTINWKSDVSFKVIISDLNNFDKFHDYNYVTLTVLYIFCCLFFGLIVILTWIISCILKNKQRLLAINE